MKIRKTIAAGVAAVAMTFAGTSVATAQTEGPATPIAEVEAPTDQTPVDNPPADKPAPEEPAADDSSNSSDSEEGSSISDMEPGEIRDWIAVFTAVVGALGTLFAFVQKYFM